MKEIFSMKFAKLFICSNIMLLLLFSGVLFAESRFSIGYKCDQIEFRYGIDSDSLPDLQSLSSVQVKLSCSNQEFSLDNFTQLSNDPIDLNLRDLHVLAEIPMQYLKSLGYEGVVVFPDPKQIDPVTGEDLRAGNSMKLSFLVWVSILQDIDVQNDGIDDNVSIRIQSELKRNLLASGVVGKPVKRETLKYWKRFGSTPSRSVQVILSPGQNPGEVLSVLKLVPRETEKIFFQASNSGSPVTGKWMLGSSYRNNQLSGIDDQLVVNYFSSDTQEVKSFRLSYEKPLVYPNIVLVGGALGYSNYDASSFAVTQFNFKGDSKYIDLYTKWNPLETEYKNYSFSFKAGFRGEQRTASNSLVSGKADASFITPEVSVLLSTRGKYLQTESTLSIFGNVQSVNTANQTLLGGVQTKDRFTRLKISYLESLKIGKWLHDQFDKSFTEKITDQILVTRFQSGFGLQNQRHLPQHQFITGGTGSVRGYPESPIAGDNGYFISVEYRIPLSPFKFKDGGSHAKGTLIPFIDWGETFVNEAQYYEGDHSILGTGIGMELNFPFGATARIDFAKPLKEIVKYGNILDGTRSSDSRVHAMLRWEF